MFMSASLAGHGRRIAAALLDLVYSSLLIGACGAVGLGLGLAAGGGDSRDGWEELGFILLGGLGGLIIGGLLWLVLTVVLVCRSGPHNGQTLGKQTVGIQAVRADGGEIAIATALLREILAKGLLVAFTSSLISGLLGFFDLGIIGAVAAIGVWYGPAFFDDEHRGLHDRLCSTLVVLAGRRAAEAAPPVESDLWAGAPQG